MNKFELNSITMRTAALKINIKGGRLFPLRDKKYFNYSNLNCGRVCVYFSRCTLASRDFSLKLSRKLALSLLECLVSPQASSLTSFSCFCFIKLSVWVFSSFIQVQP